MLKKILIGIGILILLAAGLFGVAYFMVQPDKDRVLNFIEENPERAAISFKTSKGIEANHNENQLLPLASTVKIIIAIEYAYQKADSTIQLEDNVSLSELDKYHYPETDGGAHNRWLSSLNLQNDSLVSLNDVAKGMIKFSSNANTEYLLDMLGINHVNERVKRLGIKKHDSIYYLVSSLFVKDYLFPNQNKTEAIENLKKLSDEEYFETCNEIHQKLKYGTLENDSLKDFDLAVQKVWSNRLPASTALEYRQLMEKLNTKTFLPKEVHENLDPILEFVMENPNNQKWLKHSGFKGGSTAFTLTKAMYATDDDDVQYSLSYFLTDLSQLESVQLKMSMNEFELAILQDREFRKKLEKVLNSY